MFYLWAICPGPGRCCLQSLSFLPCCSVPPLAFLQVIAFLILAFTALSLVLVQILFKNAVLLLLAVLSPLIISFMEFFHIYNMQNNILWCWDWQYFMSGEEGRKISI